MKIYDFENKNAMSLAFILSFLFILMVMCIEVMADSKIIKASSFGFDADDATICLQKAINSGGSEIIIDNVGKPWIIRPVKLRSNQKLIFEDGVVVWAKKGEFKSRGACLFKGRDLENFSMVGQGKVVLKMNKKDYQDKKRYLHSEWRNLIAIYGGNKIIIKNLTLLESGGDGIYLGSGSKYLACNNILIDSAKVLKQHRQGISVISARNLIIRNSKFNYTSGTSPMHGIDFEPNNKKQCLVNCLIENCEFGENESAGVYFHLLNLDSSSEPVSIKINNCKLYKNRLGIGCAASKDNASPVKGIIEINNCNISNSEKDIMKLSNLQFGGMRFVLNNCTTDNRQNPNSKIILRSGGVKDFGNIVFNNLVFLTKNLRSPLVFYSFRGNGIENLDGKIVVRSNDAKKVVNLQKFMRKHKPDLQIKKFKVKVLDLKKLYPGFKKNGYIKKNVFLRGRFTFLVWAKRDVSTKIAFRAKVFNKANFRPMPVNIYDSNRTLFEKIEINKHKQVYTLNSNANQIFVMEINTLGNAVEISSNGVGQCFATENRCGIYGSRGHFYFWVPAGCENINIELNGNGKETVSAVLISPEGKIVDRKENVSGTAILKGVRGKKNVAEVWSFKITHAVEDYSFRIGEPLLPLVALSVDNILRD